MLDLQSIGEIARKLLSGVDDAFSVIFMLFVVFSFLDGAIRKKNQPLPPPSTDDEFNIPNLANDPTVEIRQEVVVEPSKKFRAENRMRPIRSTQSEPKSESEPPVLNADDALNAMILTEIFAKPKALRRRE